MRIFLSLSLSLSLLLIAQASAKGNQASAQEDTGENVGCPSAGEGEVPATVNLLQTSYLVKHSNDGHDGHQSTKDNRQDVPCQCDIANSEQKPSSRTVPRCVFIDLGAANGNTFHGKNSFLTGAYGNVDRCPSQQWHAVLVEANPYFDTQLQEVSATYAGNVTILPSTAAFMCEGTTSFYLDAEVERNFWGSSMKQEKADVLKERLRKKVEKVTVPTLNLNRILQEYAIPEDYVMVKMDIEGAEYDILPCLADSPSASLIDTLFMEEHAQFMNLTGTRAAQFHLAKTKLKAAGAAIPLYSSRTF